MRWRDSVRTNPRAGRGEGSARVLDPSAAFHVGHVRKLRALQQLRISSAQLANSAKRLEDQALDLRSRRSRFEDQARRALASEKEPEALQSLIQAQALTQQIEDLDTRVAALGELCIRLEASGRRLELSVASSRSEADALQAQSQQSQYLTARLVVNEPAAWSERSTFVGTEGQAESPGDDGDLDVLVQQARDKTLWAQARAQAVSELLDHGGDQPMESRAGGDVALREGAVARLAELKAELETELQREPTPELQPERTPEPTPELQPGLTPEPGGE